MVTASRKEKKFTRHPGRTLLRRLYDLTWARDGAVLKTKEGGHYSGDYAGSPKKQRTRLQVPSARLMGPVRINHRGHFSN